MLSALARPAVGLVVLALVAAVAVGALVDHLQGTTAQVTRPLPTVPPWSGRPTGTPSGSVPPRARRPPHHPPARATAPAPESVDPPRADTPQAPGTPLAPGTSRAAGEPPGAGTGPSEAPTEPSRRRPAVRRSQPGADRSLSPLQPQPVPPLAQRQPEDHRTGCDSLLWAILSIMLGCPGDR
jgi:hypothetical protein